MERYRVEPMDIEEIRHYHRLLMLQCSEPMDLWHWRQDRALWANILARQAYYYPDVITQVLE